MTNLEKQQAHEETHALVPDPPHTFSRFGCLTCRACGRAVIVRPDGSRYGSACEKDCNRVQIGWWLA